MPTSWYANGLSFTCTQCGNCCTGGPGYVWISHEEIRRLAAHLNLTPEEVVERYCRKINGRFSLNENQNARGEFDCVFLEEDEIAMPGPDGAEVRHRRRRCTIYPVRPLQCRTWPFWEGNLASEANWNRASDRCPGINRGRSFSLPQIQALKDAKDWPEKPPGSG